ncbi:hypothetical protein QUU72_22380, partial [Xanthomonas citri pv. citri]
YTKYIKRGVYMQHVVKLRKKANDLVSRWNALGRQPHTERQKAMLYNEVRKVHSDLQEVQKYDSSVNETVWMLGQVRQTLLGVNNGN